MSDKQEAAEKEIADIIKGIFAAFDNHDPEGIEGHMHPESTVWDVFTPDLIRGVDERNKFHEDDQKQMQARGTLSYEISDPIVDLWGDDTAIAKFYLTFEYQPPNATSGKVRITDVLQRIDGRWMVVHHHEGLIPEGVPPTDDPKP
jgi:ketosteroid isomerase-like protein